MNVDPLVSILYREMIRQNLSIGQVARAANLSWYTVEGWRKGRDPNISDLRKAFKFVGYELVVEGK